MRDILAASASPEEVAGFTVGQAHEIPDLVAGHLAAGVAEVIFSAPFADAAGIAAVGAAFA
jgi:hypothetical protein